MVLIFKLRRGHLDHDVAVRPASHERADGAHWIIDSGSRSAVPCRVRRGIRKAATPTTTPACEGPLPLAGRRPSDVWLLGGSLLVERGVREYGYGGG